MYKALVIDDNSVSAVVLSELLKMRGLTVDTAESGTASLQREDITSFDLIFSDYLMPDMDGIEAAENIQEKAQKEGKILPVILCTSNVEEAAQAQKKQKNIAAILQKPIQVSKLERVLRECIAWEPDWGKEKQLQLPKMEEQLQIPGLDTNNAIAFLGSVRIYQGILKEFYKAIPAKAKAIRQYGKTYNKEAFRIEVHGLKSTSRLIGAWKLSTICEEAEEKCLMISRRELWDMAEKLVEGYESYRERLQPYVEQEPAKKQKKRAESGSWKKWLTSLRTALEDFEFDEALNLVEEMKQYELPSDWQQVVDELQEKIDNIDYEGGIAVIDAVL